MVLVQIFSLIPLIPIVLVNVNETYQGGGRICKKSMKMLTIVFEP